MKNTKIHRIVQVFALCISLMLLVASCGPSYVRVDSRRPYGYGYGRPYRYGYVVPPPPTRVIVVPRYGSPGRYHGYRHYRGRRGRY